VKLAPAIAMAALLFARAAQADGDSRARAKEAFERGESEVHALAFDRALASYKEAIAIDPSASTAGLARTRVGELESHSEGGFAPLVALERVRRSPSSTRAEVDALGAAAPGFPAGRVRAEAELVVGEALWHRFDDRASARVALERAVEDEGADRLTRSLALNELCGLFREGDDLPSAERAVDRFGDLAPALRTEIRRLARRARFRVTSAYFLAALGLVALALAARAVVKLGLDAARTRLVRSFDLALALYLGGGASLLVRARGEGDTRPFLWLGLGVLAVAIAGRTIGLSSTRPAARAARAIVCIVGVLAVAFLSIERTDASFLASVGL
jgi:hypothetical protein